MHFTHNLNLFVLEAASLILHISFQMLIASVYDNRVWLRLLKVRLSHFFLRCFPQPGLSNDEQVMYYQIRNPCDE